MTEEYKKLLDAIAEVIRFAESKGFKVIRNDDPHTSSVGLLMGYKKP